VLGGSNHNKERKFGAYLASTSSSSRVRTKVSFRILRYSDGRDQGRASLLFQGGKKRVVSTWTGKNAVGKGEFASLARDPGEWKNCLKSRRNFLIGHRGRVIVRRKEDAILTTLLQLT